jgi:hypothetical protein
MVLPMFDGINNDYFGRALFQDHEDPDDIVAPLPALEEIRLEKDQLWTDESQSGPGVATFQPFVSARQQAGRPVKVFFCL